MLYMRIYFVILFLFFQIFSFSQDRAFKIYNAKGENISYRMLKLASIKADIVLFGENHNDPISHWMQLEITKSLFEKHAKNLVLGAEMLESDDQIKVDEYLSGFIREKDFEKEAKIWINHKTDYRPLLNFAKDNGLRFVATNIPRRFASMTYRFGIDTLEYLPEESKRFIAPLPILYDTSLRCYKDMLVMADGHGGENLPYSQAIKDATMAHFIYQNMDENTRFIHYNGSYHSRFYESIMWYLLQLDDNLNIVTIETVEQENIDRFNEELIGNADYFIVVDEDMCKTY